jgi:hypothetical protein
VSRPAGPVPLGLLNIDRLPPGVPETQARAIWRVVGAARAGRFDPLEARAALVAGGYSAGQADALVEEVLGRLGRGRRGDGPGAA